MYLVNVWTTVVSGIITNPGFVSHTKDNYTMQQYTLQYVNLPYDREKKLQPTISELLEIWSLSCIYICAYIYLSSSRIILEELLTEQFRILDFA